MLIRSSRVDLFAENIEREWNVPILQSAAAMFDTTCRFIGATCPKGAVLEPSDARGAAASEGIGGILLASCDLVLACETTRRAKNVFDFVPHARKTAPIVGNEIKGLEKATLRSADQVVSIPMPGIGMESLNVGVAAAVALWALTRSKGSHESRTARGKGGLPDVLFVAPDDPSEIGSVFRSAWAFGWKRAFLDDPHEVWFGRDRSIATQGRAAARRFKNPLAILPYRNLGAKAYEVAYVLTYDRSVTPFSRMTVAEERDAVLVIPAAHAQTSEAVQAAERAARKTMLFQLDCPGDASLAHYRLAASIVLAEVANQRAGGRKR